MKPHRKEQMQNLIREHRMHNAHQDALVSRRVQPVEEDDELGADKQGAFVGEGTPHDAASKAGCSASGYSGTGVEVGVAGSIPARSTKRFTYSIEWDDAGYWPGHNVRCVETGQWMRSEGFSTERKAQAFLDDLEVDL